MAEPGSTLGIPKAQFLESVRLSLQRPDAAPQPPYPSLEQDLAGLESLAQDLERRIAADGDSLLSQLAETAALRGWQVHRAANAEDALGYVTSVANAGDSEKVVRSRQPVFDELPVDAALTNAGLSVTTVSQGPGRSREALREEIAASGIGITGADYAVAETGSVVVVPRSGLSRLVSLVPPVHIALVRPGDVVPTLDDVFLLRRLEYYRKEGDMGSYLNFITGPSRTADIEQTLVVGVHGPKEVHMVLLG